MEGRVTKKQLINKKEIRKNVEDLENSSLLFYESVYYNS